MVQEGQAQIDYFLNSNAVKKTTLDRGDQPS